MMLLSWLAGGLLILIGMWFGRQWNYRKFRRNMVNVHDFGAVGDGVHDDGPAIRAANQAALESGKLGVYYPPGNYKLGNRRVRPKR
jgi:hypothetical protein